MLNNYNEIASIYAKDDKGGTVDLAYKYIPEILAEYAIDKKTLDFGCGSGLSTRFLKNLNLDVEGVDINHSMLLEARNENDGIKYSLIEDAKLPYADNTFDIVFSSFVLLEISSKDKMLQIFNEIYRVLKTSGIFVAVTGSEDMYKYPWLSLDVDFPENKNLTSGAIAKVHLKDINLSVYDYYWTDTDYLEVIHNTNFNLVKKQYPLGEALDGYLWITELHKSPYVIYVLRK